ncbi:hypothetical protein D9M72_619650 [compost metagenome]
MGGEKTRQDRQAQTLLGRGVLGDYAGAAQAGAGIWKQVGQVQQLGAERQVIHVADELVLGQVRRFFNRFVAFQVLGGSVELQAVVAQLAAHIRPVLRPLQGDNDVGFALGQADEVRQRQDIH